MAESHKFIATIKDVTTIKFNLIINKHLIIILFIICQQLYIHICFSFFYHLIDFYISITKFIFYIFATY